MKISADYERPHNLTLFKFSMKTLIFCALRSRAHNSRRIPTEVATALRRQHPKYVTYILYALIYLNYESDLELVCY